MTQLGKLSPLYRFVLNPFADVRFSTCPECSQRTLLRKVPLAVHVDPHHPVLLNKHCRYCPDCDLMIAHKDEIEHLLAITFEQRNPGVIGNDYLILGTVDKSAWRKQQKVPIPMGELAEYLHDFKEYLTLFYTPSGWYPEDQPPVLRDVPPPSKRTAFTNPKFEESPSTNTIDDPRQVESLLKKMGLHLPIPAEIQRGPANYLRSRGSFIPQHRNVGIQNVFYAGDEGGIMCALSPKDSKEPVVISLTHLKIPYCHPLEKEIRAYQKARIRKLK
jgi:hypothetical protein